MDTSPGTITRERPAAIVGFVSKIYAIAANTFVESIRQPVFAVIVAIAAALIVLSPYLTFFTLQQSPRMVTDMGLATVMLAGLLLAAFSASSVISEEIANKTALTVISKPVYRMEFILGKSVGVMGSLMVGVYLLSLVLVLSASGGAFEADIEEELSMGVMFCVFGSMFLAVCYGIYSNFFQDRPFPSRAIGAALPLFTLTFLIFCFLDPREYKLGPFGTGISLQVIFGCAMVMWAIAVLAAFAIAASTRLNVVVNVTVCSAIFVLGLLSDFLFLSEFSRDYRIAQILYLIVPNLQVFWVANLIGAKVPLGLSHVLITGGYALCLVTGFLFLAMALFQERQLA